MPRFTQPSFHLVPPAWCFQLAPLKPYSQPKGNIRHRKWVKSQAMWTKPLVFLGSHVWIMVLKDSYRAAHATHVSESHSRHCIQKLILWWDIKMHLWIHLSLSYRHLSKVFTRVLWGCFRASQPFHRWERRWKSAMLASHPGKSYFIYWLLPNNLISSNSNIWHL